MGLHHNLAIGLLAASLTVPASAQWRDWTDPHIAVEDLSAAVWERLECTFTGIATDEVAVCVGDETVTMTNIYRAYGWSLAGVHTNTPSAWPEQVRLSAGTNLVIAGYQTDRWTKVVGTVTSEVVAVYTNWMTQDYSIITNADCTVVTSELATVVWTSTPSHYLPRDYLAALDAAIVDMSDPPNSTRRRLSPWRLYDPAAFDPAANCTTSWLWTVRDQWEPWTYTYPAEPPLITHSQLCARAGLSITTFVDSVTDRGPTYPRTVTNGYLTAGWQIGQPGIKDVIPPVPVTELRHRYVTNLYTSGLWTYAPLPALRAPGPDTNTPFLGRILGTLTAVRSAVINEVWPYDTVWQARGFGGPDGFFRWNSDSFTFTNGGYFMWTPAFQTVGPRYITDSNPYPDNYMDPTNPLPLWSSSGIAPSLHDSIFWPPRGFSGCYTPSKPSITTTGDVAPAARWHYRQGDTAWGYKGVVLQPAALPAYLWVTINSTNDRYCSGAVEPAPIPDPLTVEVVGSWWRPAVATQGVTLVVSTQTVQITQAGRIDLENPITGIISMTASNALGGTEFYTRDGIEITAHLGEYTNALAMILDPAPWWMVVPPGWETMKPVLEDRKKMLSAMGGLALVISERSTTNIEHATYTTNYSESECSSLSYDWLWFPYYAFVPGPSHGVGCSYPDWQSGSVYGGPVRDACEEITLSNDTNSRPSETRWAVEDNCKLTTARSGHTISTSGWIEYADVGRFDYPGGYVVERNYSKQYEQSASAQKATAVARGVITDRVPGTLAMRTRALTEKGLNEKRTRTVSVTYPTTPASGEGGYECSGDGSMGREQQDEEQIEVRPAFYAVTDLQKYGSPATVSASGWVWEAVIPHPAWPSSRLLATFTESYTANGQASQTCTYEDEFQRSSYTATFTRNESRNHSERVHSDGYTVQTLFSYAPEWRFQ